MRKVKIFGLSLGGMVALASMALAATWTLNLPLVAPVASVPGNYYPQLTGYELFPADTLLPQGAQPQSVAPSLFQAAALGAASVATGHTGTASGGAVTLSVAMGTVTSESLSTAAGSSYTLTLTNTLVKTTSAVQAQAFLGTSTVGQPTITSITPASGSVVIVVKNTGANAFSGTLTIPFQVLAPNSTN